MDWFMHAMRNYANFQGRARRTEYWIFTLFVALFIFGSFIIGALVAAGSDGEDGIGALIALVGIVVLIFTIPSLAVAVRRLHDVGKSGSLLVWQVVINVVGSVISTGDEGIGAVFTLGSFAFGIYLLVLYCTDSNVGPNKYGPNPKGIGNDIPTTYVSNDTDNTPTDETLVD